MDVKITIEPSASNSPRGRRLLQDAGFLAYFLLPWCGADELLEMVLVCKLTHRVLSHSHTLWSSLLKPTLLKTVPHFENAMGHQLSQKLWFLLHTHPAVVPVRLQLESSAPDVDANVHVDPKRMLSRAKSISPRSSDTLPQLVHSSLPKMVRSQSGRDLAEDRKLQKQRESVGEWLDWDSNAPEPRPSHVIHVVEAGFDPTTVKKKSAMRRLVIEVRSSSDRNDRNDRKDGKEEPDQSTANTVVLLSGPNGTLIWPTKDMTKHDPVILLMIPVMKLDIDNPVHLLQINDIYARYSSSEDFALNAVCQATLSDLPSLITFRRFWWHYLARMEMDQRLRKHCHLDLLNTCDHRLGRRFRAFFCCFRSLVHRYVCRLIWFVLIACIIIIPAIFLLPFRSDGILPETVSYTALASPWLIFMTCFVIGLLIPLLNRCRWLGLDPITNSPDYIDGFRVEQLAVHAHEARTKAHLSASLLTHDKAHLSAPLLNPVTSWQWLGHRLSLLPMFIGSTLGLFITIVLWLIKSDGWLSEWSYTNIFTFATVMLACDNMVGWLAFLFKRYGGPFPLHPTATAFIDLTIDRKNHISQLLFMGQYIALALKLDHISQVSWFVILIPSYLILLIAFSRAQVRDMNDWALVFAVLWMASITALFALLPRALDGHLSLVLACIPLWASLPLLCLYFGCTNRQ